MLEIIDHRAVREIRLARPPVNALDPALLGALENALGEAGETAQAVVVSGQPGMFSAGLDIPELMHLDREQMSRFLLGFNGTLRTIATMPVPTVFALTGHNPAGGIVLALFGDYRIMPRGPFKTGLNEVQVGLVVPGPAQRALVRLVGERTAEHMLVAGELMEGERALEIGLVDELADDPEAVVARALAWCEQHIALPRAAMLETRKMARSGLHRIFEDEAALKGDQFIEWWFMEHTQKALHALLERLGKA